MSFVMSPLKDLLLKVDKWNPAKEAGDTLIKYIDLSSVDKDSKRIIDDEVQELFGSKAPSRARQLVSEKDILVATVRPNLNGVASVPGEFEGATASTGYCVLRVNEELLDSKYLFYWVQTELFVNDMISKASGANYPAVSDKIIKDSKIPLPPLEEQKRIAAILDKVAAIRQKRKQAIELADEFLRSVFLDIFGDPVTNPKGWEVKPVGELVKCIVPGRDKPKSFTGEMPWITTNDLQHLGTTTKSDKKLGLSDEEISAVKARIIPKGSVLMTCVGDLGIISLAGNDMVMNQQLHAFLTSEYFEQEFLMFALSFQKQYMLKMASSTTVPYMNKTVCSSVPVIVPNLELQKQFKKIYLNTVCTLENYKISESKKESLFKSLSQKAFSGQL